MSTDVECKYDKMTEYGFIREFLSAASSVNDFYRVNYCEFF